MDIKDIVNAFPVICKDPAEVFFLFLQVYPEDQLLPIISKQFGGKFGVDNDAMQKKLKEVKEFADEKMLALEKIHRDVNV